MPWSYAEGGFPPIVGYITQLSLAEECLDEMARLAARGRPSSEWALKLGAACAQAERWFQVINSDLLASPPGPGAPGRRLSADIKSLTRKLGVVSELLARQPEAEGRK